jgi:pyridoxine/pyridoxamine 5'-phosphate oxidase
MDKNELLNFIKKHDLMMLSTVNTDGKPQAAVVEFGELDNLSLIFDTLTSSRKHNNLQHFNEVAVVIGWDDNITVQIEGSAHELNGPELEQAKRAYFAKNSRARKWENRDNIAYFLIRPSWIRYSDLNQNPWYVKEISIA